MTFSAAGFLDFAVVVFAIGLVILLGTQAVAALTDSGFSIGWAWAGGGLMLLSAVPVLMAGLLATVAPLFNGSKAPQPTGMFVTAIVLLVLGVLGFVAWLVAGRLYASEPLSFVATMQSTGWLGASVTVAIGGVWLLLEAFLYVGIIHAAPPLPVSTPGF